MLPEGPAYGNTRLLAHLRESSLDTAATDIDHASPEDDRRSAVATARTPDTRMADLGAIGDATKRKMSENAHASLSDLSTVLREAIGKGCALDAAISSKNRTIFEQVRTGAVGTEAAEFLKSDSETVTAEHAVSVAGTSDFNAFSDAVTKLRARTSILEEKLSGWRAARAFLSRDKVEDLRRSAANRTKGIFAETAEEVCVRNLLDTSALTVLFCSRNPSQHPRFCYPSGRPEVCCGKSPSSKTLCLGASVWSSTMSPSHLLL